MPISHDFDLAATDVRAALTTAPHSDPELIRCASIAASSHITQPWRYPIAPNAITDHDEGHLAQLDLPAPGRSMSAAVDLYWIPLGAGSPIVEASGRLFETLSAWWHRRPRCDLYHAALEVSAPHGRLDSRLTYICATPR